MGCRVCDSTNLELVLDLGQQPWGNNFLQKDMLGDEVFYPLRLFFCVDCGTVQLDFTIPKEVMFGDHTYLSGVTSSLKNHFKEVADETVKKFFPDIASRKVSVLDIGSNDGSQLKYYESLGCDILGVESSVTTAKIAIVSRLTTCAIRSVDSVRDLPSGGRGVESLRGDDLAGGGKSSSELQVLPSTSVVPPAENGSITPAIPRGQQPGVVHR